MACTSFESFRTFFSCLSEEDRKKDANRKVFNAFDENLDFILLQLAVNMHIKYSSWCIQMEDQNGANVELTTAIAIDSSNPDGYYHRAQLRFNCDDMQLAIDDYDHCCRLAPDFDEAQSVFWRHLCLWD